MMRAAGLALACLSLGACLSLSGCGFTPVYGGGQGLAFADQGPINVPEIRAEASPGAAPGRTGHFLRQALVRSVGPGVPGFKSGTLEVELNQTIQGLAFAPDLAASRSDYIGAARWTLRAPGGDVLGFGTVTERVSFNFADAPYADMAAQTAAQERLAGLLAQAIRYDMIAAAGKAVDQKAAAEKGAPVIPPAPGTANTPQ